MAEYFEYVRRLQFDGEPDYLYLTKLFRKSLVESGETEDFKFDWTYNQHLKNWVWNPENDQITRKRCIIKWVPIITHFSFFGHDPSKKIKIYNGLNKELIKRFLTVSICLNPLFFCDEFYPGGFTCVVVLWLDSTKICFVLHHNVLFHRPQKGMCNVQCAMF